MLHKAQARNFGFHINWMDYLKSFERHILTET